MAIAQPQRNFPNPRMLICVSGMAASSLHRRTRSPTSRRNEDVHFRACPRSISAWFCHVFVKSPEEPELIEVHRPQIVWRAVELFPTPTDRIIFPDLTVEVQAQDVRGNPLFICQKSSGKQQAVRESRIGPVPARAGNA